MNLLPLRAYDSYITAHLRKQQLEAEGIHAVLKDEYTVTIDPILSNAVGGIKILVPESQWGQASKLIEQLEEAYRKSVACPACGAFQLERVPNTKKPANWLSALLTWCFGSYAVPVSSIYHCFQCGYETENLPGQKI